MKFGANFRVIKASNFRVIKASNWSSMEELKVEREKRERGWEVEEEGKCIFLF